MRPWLWLPLVACASGGCTFREIRVRDGSADVANDLTGDARLDGGTDGSPDAIDARDVCMRERCGPPVNDQVGGAVVIFEAPATVLGGDGGDVPLPPPDATSDAGTDSAASEAGSDAAMDAISRDVAVDVSAPDVVDAPEDAVDAGMRIPTHFEVPVDTFESTNSVALCDSTRGGDVWFRFRIASRELVYADTHDATWHTMLAFADETGTPMLSVTEYRVCDANAACPGEHGSQIAAVLDPGTYHIVVAGIGTEAGTTTLYVRHIPVGTGDVTRYTPASGPLMVSLPGGDTVNGACANANGGENLYFWTTCPSYAGETFFVHGCANGLTVPQVTYTNGYAVPICSTQPLDCGEFLGVHYGAEFRTTLAAGAGLHALYTGAWGRADRGTYTLMTTFSPP